MPYKKNKTDSRNFENIPNPDKKDKIRDSIFKIMQEKHLEIMNFNRIKVDYEVILKKRHESEQSIKYFEERIFTLMQRYTEL